MAAITPTGGACVLRGYVVNETTGERVPVGATLIIGRTAECGLVIEDTAASRRHVEITARKGSFVWKDLGSTNGTRVNGARMLAGELKHGDCIQIGETVLRFVVEETVDEVFAGSDSTIFRETVMDRSGEIRTTERQNKSTELLQAVYTVMNQIATSYELCPLIDQILSTTMRAINAQRGALFLSNEQEELLPCPVCRQVHTIRDGVLRPRQPGEVQISNTVAMRVLRNGESVLFQDMDSDGELSTAESIITLKLRSIVCVPLRAKLGILGILYIDSDRPNQTYTEEDMLLATSVGCSAGLALENARMHRQILDKHRMEQEIATAWTIQEGFLVKDWPNTDPRFEVYGEMHPAKVVGGDFYDVVSPGPGLVGILIGDVSGKGVPAALTMAQLLAEFRLRARESRSPAEVLSALNAGLYQRSQRGIFCTMAYFVLDLASGTALYANAGHLPAVRLGGEGTELFGEASGPPLGVLPEAAWADTPVRLGQGDLVLLYTDGILEARRGPSYEGETISGPVEEFQSERLCRAAGEAAGQPPRGVIEAVLGAVREYSAPLAPHDDCTLISVRYVGHA